MTFLNLDVSKMEILHYFLDLVYTLEDPELESNSLKGSHYHLWVKKYKNVSIVINALCYLVPYRGLTFMCLILYIFTLQYALLII